MKAFIYSIMTDRRRGALFVPLKAALFLVSVFYGIAIFIRMLL